MASLQALGAAAQDRKARLAQLKSLKRKQPDSNDTATGDIDATPKAAIHDASNHESDTTKKYISGRNYDSETRNAKLGFEQAPSDGRDTLEKQAAALALEVKQQSIEAEKTETPLDLFKLQPKKPNWDLKRDLERKMDVLNVRTDNAIARLVRERIANQQQAAKARAAASSDRKVTGLEDSGRSEAAGIDGTTLVEAANIREQEDAEEARREREEEAALLDGS
jgi:coiled-coil domain-containing protein 12